MNLKQKIARAALLIFLCALSAFGAAWRYSASQAQDYPSSLIELRADTIVQQGEELIVDVYADIAAPAYGFGFQIDYDPAILELQQQQDTSGSSVPLQVGGVFANAQRIRNVAETVDGSATIDTVYTLLPPAEAAIGESFIGRLSFLVLQEAPIEIRLESPRLIALEGASAVDLPVDSAEVLALSPGMPVEETIVEAAEPVQAADSSEAASRVRMAEPAPVAVAESETAPALDSAIATLNTPNDALAAMSRASNLMNAVLIGLLTMITILLGVISVSMVLDAVAVARTPKPTLAYAYAPRSVQATYVKPRPQAQAPRPRPQKARAREVVVDMEPTIPSRSVLTAQLRMQRKNSQR